MDLNRPVVLVCGLAAFLAIIGAFVALVLTGHAAESGGLVSAVVTLLGVLGLAGHVDARTRAQNAKLDTITRQTNGVLDQRIHEGTTRAVRQVLQDAGMSNVSDPSAPVPPPAAPAPVAP